MNALDDISTIKVKVARAQLGLAMDLFIRDKDAYSVQALACEGCEVIDGVAKRNNINRFALHIMRNYPDVDESEIKRRQNLYWNAIKHVTNPKGQVVFVVFYQFDSAHILQVRGRLLRGCAGVYAHIQELTPEAWLEVGACHRFERLP